MRRVYFLNTRTLQKSICEDGLRDIKRFLQVNPDSKIKIKKITDNGWYNKIIGVYNNGEIVTLYECEEHNYFHELQREYEDLRDSFNATQNQIKRISSDKRHNPHFDFIGYNTTRGVEL